MNLRYPRLFSLAAGLLLLAASASAADLAAETPLPSVGSGIVADGPIGPVVSPGAVEPLTPGLDGPAIECNNFDTSTGYTGGFLFIPPDPYDAAGPAHVINITNVIIEWRPKTGTVDTPQYQNSLKGFFSGLAGTLGTECFDPKVLYDQYGGRFVVVTLERTLSGTTVTGSRILVAVSKTSDPNAGWWRFAIDSMLNIGGINRWADFPGIGVDDKAVYITNNMFSVTSPYTYGGTRLWIINKTPTYSGPDNNIAFTVYDPFTASGALATTAMPTHMWGPLPAGTGGYPLGTYLVSYSGINDGTNVYLQVIEVADPLAGAGGPYFNMTQPFLGPIDALSGFPGATQLGTTRRIATNDRRAQNAVWRNGQLLTCAAYMPVVGDPDFGEVTARWWRLNCPGPIASLSIADQGNAGAEDLGANTYTFFPHVEFDCNLNMAIGFAASNGSIYPGAYYATRMFADPAGTVGNTATLALGVTWYVRTFTTSTTATSRWGDYSGIALCPVDESTFWIYNEYAGPQGTPTGSGTTIEYGRWHTKLGKFHLKQPVSVAITSFDALARGGVVALRGSFRSDLGVEGVNVYRGDETGAMFMIGKVDASGERFEYTDRTVVAGSTYRYQIGVTDGDGEFYSPIVKVSVGRVDASVAQNEPNPFNPSTTIRFTVPDQGHVALNVYDASGQLVRTLIDGVRSSGAHDVTWDGRDNNGAPVGSGVYFYRFTAGKFSESKKMVLLK